MSGRFNLSTLQELSNAGLLQSGSRIKFRPAGSPTTLQDSYSNPSLTTPNANPVVADSYGRFGDIFLSDLAYRVEILPPAGNDTPVFTFDPVYKDRVIIQATAAPANPWPDMEYVNTTDGRRYRRNRANSAWVDLGPYDGVGNTAAKSDVIAASSTTLFVTPDALEAIWGQGTDIVSAATLTLPASEGGFFVVTGSTGISNIAATTAGRRIACYFSGSPLLTDGANFDLGGKNIQLSAGDFCEFLYYNSIWYLVNRARVSVPGVRTSAVDATIADTDRDGVIIFTGMAADKTLTLPAVAGRAGFRFTLVIKDAYTFGVTVDGNAAEQVDGQATRKSYGPTTISFFCDGTAWYTVSGTWVFMTGQQTLTQASHTSVAHGQPSKPHAIFGFLECVTTDGGYGVGERVAVFNQDTTSAAASLGQTYGGDAANLWFVTGNNAAIIGRFPQKSATIGSTFTPTPANWKLNVIGEWRA